MRGSGCFVLLGDVRGNHMLSGKITSNENRVTGMDHLTGTMPQHGINGDEWDEWDEWDELVRDAGGQWHRRSHHAAIKKT